jgi:hypothetical protein
MTNKYHAGQQVKVTVTSAQIQGPVMDDEVLTIEYDTELGTFETVVAVDSAEVVIEPCSCGTVGTGNYEGPQQDCPLHGDLVAVSRTDLRSALYGRKVGLTEAERDARDRLLTVAMGAF